MSQQVVIRSGMFRACFDCSHYDLIGKKNSLFFMMLFSHLYRIVMLKSRERVPKFNKLFFNILIELSFHLI